MGQNRDTKLVHSEGADANHIVIYLISKNSVLFVSLINIRSTLRPHTIHNNSMKKEFKVTKQTFLRIKLQMCWSQATCVSTLRNQTFRYGLARE